MNKQWIVVILVGLLLAACGYKADLYLPDASPQPPAIDKQKAEKGVKN